MEKPFIEAVKKATPYGIVVIMIYGLVKSFDSIIAKGLLSKLSDESSEKLITTLIQYFFGTIFLLGLVAFLVFYLLKVKESKKPAKRVSQKDDGKKSHWKIFAILLIISFMSLLIYFNVGIGDDIKSDEFMYFDELEKVDRELWDVRSTNRINTTIVESGVVYENKRNSNFYRYINIKLAEYGDQLELGTKFTTDNRNGFSGVVVDFSNGESIFCNFNDSKEVHIGYGHLNSAITPLIDWDKNFSFRPNRDNLLSINIEKDQVYFYINDALIGSIKNRFGQPTRFGYSLMNSTIMIDEFYIK